MDHKPANVYSRISNKNPNPRQKSIQAIPRIRNVGSQVTEPEILGYDNRKSQAGNAYLDSNKTSVSTATKGSADSGRDNQTLLKQRRLTGQITGEIDHLLSAMPSMVYSFITPPPGSQLQLMMDSAIFVRSRSLHSDAASSRSRHGSIKPFQDNTCEGLFGESLECWEDLQADASTDTKPIGYKDLELYPVSECKDAETQVNNEELDSMAAVLRGIIVSPNNILWMTNGDFSINKAEKQLEDYINSCWKVCSKWFYHIQFLHAEEGCYRNKYHFEVKWSLPTKENPIPMAAASVFFTFDVEIYSGRDEPVKVYYILEGTRFPHTPGEIPFQQKWLSSIICEKMMLIRSVKSG